MRSPRPPAVPLLVTAALTGFAVVQWLLRRPLGVDSSVYRAGGSAVLRDEPLYAHLSALPDWAPELPFTYPPFAALLFTPLAALPPQLCWGGLAIASVVALHLVLRQFAAPPALTVPLPVVLLGAFCLQPVWQTIGLGQLNLVLMAIVVVDLLLLHGTRYSGLLIGLAAAIKLTPLIFVGHLLLTGRRADAMRALVAFSGATALAMLVLPADSLRYWTSAIFSDHFAEMKGWVGNQSWQGFLARTLPEGALQPVLGVALVGTTLFVAALLVRELHRRDDERGALLVTAGCGLLVSPISWTHHWVWIVPVSCYLLVRARWWVSSVVAFPFLGWSLALVPAGAGREQDWGPGEIVAGNAYLLAATLAGAIMVVRLRSCGGSRKERASPRTSLGERDDRGRGPQHPCR